MERSIEARRSNMATANGMSRRRQRNSSIRESNVVEDDVQMELQNSVRLRDRASKRDRYKDRDRYRDREFSNHHKFQNKRRRGDSLTTGEEERTEEESVAADEEYFEIEDRRATRIVSHHSTLLNLDSRKFLPPTKALKASDEFIGALVPRKARSASVKRSHERWLSRNGGFWEDQKASSSPLSRSSEANSPSSSNVSVRKKMKPKGPKTRLPKVVKCSSSSVHQEDIEIEIAEVLFGLKKQSQNSKTEEDNNSGKVEPIDAKPSFSVLPRNTRPESDLLSDGAGPKKKKVTVDDSLNLVCDGSVSISVKIESKLEISSPRTEQTATNEVDASKASSMTVEPLEEVTNHVDGSGGRDGPVTGKKSISAKEESARCLKLNVDFQDTVVTEVSLNALESESPKDDKFKIDLMASPSVVSSPERDGVNYYASDPSLEANDVEMKSLVKDEEKTDRFLKKEPVVEQVEEKIEAIGEECELKIDLETQNQDDVRDNFVKLQQQSQKLQHLQPKSVEKTESSSVPIKISVAGWPNGLQPLGYMPPFQPMTPMNDSTTSATTQQKIQYPPFMLPQPQPKRCASHCYIARNIYVSQQIAKMNPSWPAGAGSASLHGAKPNNPNAMPLTENIIHGNPLQGSFPHLNPNSGLDKCQAVASFLHPARNDKSYAGVNFMDPALHAPAFTNPVSQKQPVVTAAANQTGPSKSTNTSTRSASVSGNSAAALPASSMASPAVAAGVSYNFRNLAGNETPYLTILQNNGYPFASPTSIGTIPAIRGGTHAQALPFFNGSFYPSQVFHPSQLQHQQQSHIQPLMQSAHQHTRVSSACSSSQKQLHSQQPRAVPVSGNSFRSSVSSQSQQTQKQHVSSSNQNRKLEGELSGENTPSAADSRLSRNQTSLYGQNFSVPLQSLNLGLMQSPVVSCGSTSQKQQQSQQKTLKHGVEFIPQAFAMSFASFTGSNTPSNLNFSSLQHKPAIFQSFPGMARQGHQVVPAAQVAQPKNHQITEVKTGGVSSNYDDGKRPSLGKSSAANVKTLVFDDSARTVNFVSSPNSGNWPSRSTTSTTVTSNVPAAVISQNFQQQQLLQLQKQQSAAAAAARSKVQKSNCLPSSSIAAKLSTNAPSFSQTLVQTNNSSQSPQWKNSARNQSNQAPPTSFTSSSTSNIKNVSLQPVRSSQGHTQISFERHSKTGISPQGKQLPSGNQSPAASGGNLKTSSSGSKAGSSIPSLKQQQTENSAASTGQKSSPVCGRNVPSILSTCPSHLSEIKY